MHWSLVKWLWNRIVSRVCALTSVSWRHRANKERTERNKRRIYDDANEVHVPQHSFETLQVNAFSLYLHNSFHFKFFFISNPTESFIHMWNEYKNPRKEDWMCQYTQATERACARASKWESNRTSSSCEFVFFSMVKRVFLLIGLIRFVNRSNLKRVVAKNEDKVCVWKCEEENRNFTLNKQLHLEHLTRL